MRWEFERVLRVVRNSAKHLGIRRILYRRMDEVFCSASQEEGGGTIAAIFEDLQHGSEAPKGRNGDAKLRQLPPVGNDNFE